jgi:hypothetical protein
VVSGESFMVLNSLSKISTISFSKKFKNSWASYIVIRKRDVTYGKITLLCPYKVGIFLLIFATLQIIKDDWTSLIQLEQSHKIKNIKQL